MIQITPQKFRLECRKAKYKTNTAGVCGGYAQANLIILPKSLAEDFENLCFRNPVACPLLGKTPIGNPCSIDDKRIIKNEDFDIRTDIPRYSVYQKGEFKGFKEDIKDEWTLDHVGFLIGCSFSFENELKKNRLTPRNQIEGVNVLMYLTTKYLNASGRFIKCPYVVSMRPYKVEEIERVREITRAFRKTHGEPLDWGYEAIERLGIRDINKPEFGDPVFIANDEVPVFWACGVTPQAAVQAVCKDIDISIMGHAPGHMLVLDIDDDNIKLL